MLLLPDLFRLIFSALTGESPSMDKGGISLPSTFALNNFSPSSSTPICRPREVGSELRQTEPLAERPGG